MKSSPSVLGNVFTVLWHKTKPLINQSWHNQQKSQAWIHTLVAGLTTCKISKCSNEFLEICSDDSKQTIQISKAIRFLFPKTHLVVVGDAAVGRGGGDLWCGGSEVTGGHDAGLSDAQTQDQVVTPQRDVAVTGTCRAGLLCVHRTAAEKQQEKKQLVRCFNLLQTWIVHFYFGYLHNSF